MAPLALLYLLHPHVPTAAAAHQLVAALLCSSASSPEQREALGLYYVGRALEGFPGPTRAGVLGSGLVAVMQALPVTSVVMLLCLERVLTRCKELAMERR